MQQINLVYYGFIAQEHLHVMNVQMQADVYVKHVVVVVYGQCLQELQRLHSKFGQVEAAEQDPPAVTAVRSQLVEQVVTMLLKQYQQVLVGPTPCAPVVRGLVQNHIHVLLDKGVVLT